MKTTITNKQLTPVFAILALILFGSVAIKAAAGDLDATFGNDGKITDFLSRGDDSARGVAVQADGKVVVAGSSSTSFSLDFSIARYNMDGSLDTTFGIDGKVTTDIASSYDQAYSLAIQRDGKIVVAGGSYGSSYDFALVRYNPDGSLDTTFGSGGKVTTAISSANDQAYSVVIQPDGKIVAAGGGHAVNGTDQAFAVARYNSDGSPDTLFDSDGNLTTDFPRSHDTAYSVATQSDGKIVAAGESYNGSNTLFTLVRYNVDGSLDNSFDGDGNLTTQAGRRALAVAIQPDGKIVAAGEAPSTSSTNSYGIVARYNPNGSIETIGVPNSTFFPTLSYYTAQSVAIHPGGKIVTAGYAVDGSGNSVLLAAVRFNANLSLDSTFGINGVVTMSGASAQAVAVQPDGKIIAAGDSFATPSGQDFIAVRYNADGSLDSGFDTDGKVTTDFGFFQGNVLNDTAIQPDGKIVAVGEVRADFAVLRYNPDGTPDRAFGSGTGKVRTDMGSSGDTARAVAIQTDGKIVVAGGSYDWDDNQCCFALARYNADGSLDTSFSGDGKVIMGGLSSGAFDIVIQPDGKIVAAGDRWDSQSGFVVIRYNTDGSLDTSFDGDGSVTTRIDSRPYALATSLAIEPGGKIVAAGYASNSYDPNLSAADFAVVRYNPNGSLDTAFDGDGVLTTTIDSHDYVRDVAIQTDGKIVVGGCTSSVNASRCDQFALARYNVNGSLDITLDGDGKTTTAIFGINRDTYLESIAIQPDGKIAAAGYSYNGSQNDFALARFNTDGSLDRSFGGGDGKATVDFDVSDDKAYGMTLDSAGRAVVVGESNGSFAIARFLVRSPVRAFADFDGDSRSDISVFRPSEGVWYLDRSSQGFSATPLGGASDQLTPADYDGDGKTDISVFRDGTWFWLNSSDGVMRQVGWGIADDTPLPADYTGDGRAELAVFRRSISTWFIYDAATGIATRPIFGVPTDRPVPADYDGDGRTEIAVYRNGTWYLRLPTGGYNGIPFGSSTDRPVVGDYDGDGKADQAVYRDGTWYLLRSSEGFAAFQFGVATDIPVPADYDGDGRTDLAVYRDGIWHISQSSAGFAAVPFGLPADRPVPAAYLP